MKRKAHCRPSFLEGPAMSFFCSYFGPLDIRQFLTELNLECTELTTNIRSTSTNEKKRAGTSAGMRNSAFRWSFSDRIVLDTFMHQLNEIREIAHLS